MGGHWYSKDGTPRHYEGKNGKPTTLREARKLNLAPSSTTVEGIKAAPWLTRYMITEAVKACEELDCTDPKTVQSYLDDTKDERTGAEEGNLIHEAIEKLFRGELPADDPYYEHASAAAYEVSEMFPDVNDWETETTFAHPLGYGGTVDLHSPSANVLIDFKTKDGDLTKKLDYGQNVQLASYRYGLGMAKARCINIFVSRDMPGVVKVHEWSQEDLDKGFDNFLACLNLWQIEKNYSPDWE